MKVYQINVVCGSGSTGRIAADLANTIQKYGGKSRIAYGRGDSPDGIDAVKVSSRLDLYLHAMFTRFTDKHGLYSKRATKRLIKDIQGYKPDIIHLHNIHGYYLNYEILFSFLKEYNKPIVWTLHDCWSYTGHCAYFDYVGCEKWKTTCFECPQKNKYPISILMDNSKDNFQRKRASFTSLDNIVIVTVSEWLRRITKDSFLKKFTVEKISNGINLQIMNPTESDLREKYQLENKKILLGVASVWDERKGLDTFIELEKRLPEEYKIVLVGLNKKQKENVSNNILAIDRITNPIELAKWYTTVDIFVNTSVEETMGLTTVEAMACGTPVIVMNTTASPELVNENCGRVVEPNDLEMLKNAVTTLDKTKKISDYCICHAKEYEKDKQYKKYIDLYQKILREAEN